MAKSALFTVSLAAHGALAVWLGYVEVRSIQAATAIEIAEVAAKRAEPPPPPAPSEPEPARPAEKPARRAAKPAPLAAPEAAPPESAAPLAPAGFSDFGLSLSGGVGVGLPVAASPGASPKPASARPAVKQLATRPSERDRCTEPPGKPRPKSVPQPQYPPAARAAGIEGKVRVELSVDASGRVVNVRLVQGLGHGLDEAALAAARRASFEPALRCGKPSPATFTISMRFTAT